MTRVAHGTQDGRQRGFDLAGAHAADEREPAGDAGRVEALAQFDHVVGGGGDADLAADRVADAAEELDVRAVEFAGALADPQHVSGAVVPAAGERVLAGERFLVAEQERLVARVDVDLAEVVVVLDLDAAGAHELEGSVDLVGELLVAAAFGARLPELLGPGVHAGEVGEAALGEGAHEVERGCRLVVRLHEPLGVGHAGRLGGRGVVDDVPAEAGQVEVADLLVVARAGLANWPAMRPPFTTGTPRE